MPLPKEFTTVTPFSKFLAMTLFIAFPFLFFFLGTEFQKTLDDLNQRVIILTVVHSPRTSPSPSPTPSAKPKTTAPTKK